MYDAALLFATALAELDRSQVGLMQYQTWIKWTKPSITTHYIFQFRVPIELLSYSFNNRWCVCRRLTPWFWVVIQRRRGNMGTHWSTTWNWWVIIICRWKVILLWPNFNLWTKFTDQDDSIVFVHYLFLFSSKTIVFCRKVSFEQNCPRFAIGNENFFILWETYLNPDVYYLYYYFNPFVFMGNGTKPENQVDIFQKKKLIRYCLKLKSQGHPVWPNP